MITRSLFRSSRPVIFRRRNTIIFYPAHTHRYLSIKNPLRFASHSTRSPVDEKIEEIQELYATAKDEFEIASEETSKKTVYAADDRAAAQEELAKLKEAFERAVSEEGGEEVRTRVGGRIRELERAVEAMEEMAMED